MSKTKTYLFHELSSYLPLLEGEEFDDLVEDIKQYGQIEPATIYEGKIIDGRNRSRACKILKRELIVKEWKPSEATGTTPLQYVISTNIMRRHLNPLQKAEIGLLIEPEIAKQTREEQLRKQSETMKEKFRKGELAGRKGEGKGTKSLSLGTKKPTINYDPTTRTAYKVAKKVRVHPDMIKKAKKIKEIAKRDPMIAEEWEKAKRKGIGMSRIYQEALIIEDIAPLPKSQQEEIKKTMVSQELTTKQIRQEIRERKDDLKRIDLAKKSRAVQKQKDEMEKLRLQIQEIKNKLGEYKNILKTAGANLIILAQETAKKYPSFKLDTPNYVSTHLEIYYDTLDVGKYDLELKKLRDGYDKLEKPLKLKLEKLENEHETKKKVIDLEKVKKNREVVWVERQQNLISEEFNKQILYKRNVEEYREKLKKLEEKYDKFR